MILENPSPLDKKLKEKALISMAYVILGCLMKESSPLVMEHGHKNEDVRHSSSITLGSIMGLGANDILKYFALVWTLENIPIILARRLTEVEHLRTICKSHLLDNMPSLWKILGGMICHPEIRSTVFNDLEDFPSSSEAFLNLRGIDKVIYHIMSDWVDYWIENKDKIHILLFVNTDGVNIYRLLNHWISWVGISQVEGNWIRNTKATIRLLRSIMYRSIKDGKMNIGGFFLLIKDVYGKRYKHENKDEIVDTWSITNKETLLSKFPLSQVGADPWIR